MHLRLIFLCSILTVVTAEEEAVIKYDTVTFNKLVPKKNHYVLFYAPWTSELKSLSPVWEELAQKIKKTPEADVVIAKVDCTTETKLCSHQDASEYPTRCMDLEPIWKQIAEEFQYEEDLVVGVVDCTMSKTTCNENEVRGYPSILWLVEGVVAEKYPSKDRTFDPLRKYVLNKLGKKEPTKLTRAVDAEEDPDLGSSVMKLEQENFHEVASSENATFVHFWTAWCSECMTLEVTWEALGEYFHSSDSPVKVTIAKVDCVLQKPLCEELQVDEFPTINVYRKGELEHIYAGGRKLDDLIDFVTLAAKTKKLVEEL
ncbi:unnamed protein product [Allacma fusca]|uniref:Thioredoxin domain-containing protein n=1 Tax=Allacma fusca TaxID=39272 RepID=A0A8J2LDZ5_9HEXA|nr:unnamed protein product [Allacma fusca]